MGWGERFCSPKSSFLAKIRMSSDINKEFLWVLPMCHLMSSPKFLSPSLDTLLVAFCTAYPDSEITNS